MSPTMMFPTHAPSSRRARLRISSAPILGLLACVSGCYFQYPHDLKRGKPLHGNASASIELHDEDHVWYSHDCDRHSQSCVWRKGELVRPRPYTTTTATYDGKSVTRGQISTLVEPDRQAAKYADMERHRSTCSLSLVPSAVFMVGSLAALGGAAASSRSGSSDIATYVWIGGAIAMVAGAVLSYPIGGFACNAGLASAQRSGISHDNETRWSTAADDQGAIAREQEIRTAVATFNRHSGKHPDDDANTAEEPASVPAAAPTRVAGNLHDALAAAGQFSTFAKLADTAQLEELTSDKHFTIFVPTDAAFAASAGFDLDKLTATRSRGARQKLRETLQAFVVQKIEPLDETVQRGFTSNRAGSHIVFHREGNVITADGYVVIDAPIETDNGVIYPLGPKP